MSQHLDALQLANETRLRQAHDEALAARDEARAEAARLSERLLRSEQARLAAVRIAREAPVGGDNNMEGEA